MYTNKSSRRESRAHAAPASPERRHSRDQHSPVRFPRLRRQSTAIDDSCLPGLGPGVWGEAREGEGQGRQARRDSLSPDSASYQRAAPGRRDSRSHLSPDRAGTGSRDVSPVSKCTALESTLEFPFCKCCNICHCLRAAVTRSSLHKANISF